MKSLQDILSIALLFVPLVFWYVERQKRIKAETDLKVVLKRRTLDEIGNDLDNTRPAYDAALRELGTGAAIGGIIGGSNEDDLSRREMQDTAQASEPPKFFKGIAREDLREGQEVEITVDTAAGTTWVNSKTASPPFVGET